MKRNNLYVGSVMPYSVCQSQSEGTDNNTLGYYIYYSRKKFMMQAQLGSK